jgi:putative transposase
MFKEFHSNFVHCVVAVAKEKDSPEIPFASTPRFYSFLSDAANEAGAQQLAAGGTGDHIHLLLSLPPTLALSPVLEEIKRLAERWIRSTVFGCRDFSWENGYTTFSIGMSQVRETIAYIERQLECHRKIDYQKELALFGEAHELGAAHPHTSGD